MPSEPNIYLISRNVRALKGEEVAYCKPGFESASDKLVSHDLHQILNEEDYRHLSAAPRIVQPKPLLKPFTLVTLEHAALCRKLFGLKNSPSQQLTAALWWRAHPHWCGEHQRLMPFRQSVNDTLYCLWIADEDEQPLFMIQDEGPLGWKPSDIARSVELHMAEGVSAWIDPDYPALYQRLAEEKQWDLSWVSARFGEIRLRAGDHNWNWHPLLGMFVQ